MNADGNPNRGSAVQLDGYTDEENVFIEALKTKAGQYAQYITFHRERNGAIGVMYYREGHGGSLNCGVVKLQGRAKYIKIKNVEMGNNYDSVFRVDGELDVLLPHVGKFVEKIKNNKKSLAKIDAKFRRMIGLEFDIMNR